MKPILAGMLALSVVAGASGAQAQSFNCRRAFFADEKVICASPDLSSLDERLNWIYRQNMRLLSAVERNSLDRDEERWVVTRRRCGADHRCIEGFYRSRIGELSARLGEGRGDDRGEPPAAMREPRRDGPASERPVTELPVAEPRRAPPPVAATRPPPERGERAMRREPAAAPASRQPSREEEARGEEATARRVPPPAASESRRSAPVGTGAETQPGIASAAAPRSPNTASSNTARPGPASGSTMPAPRIEFADPAPGPTAPAR